MNAVELVHAFAMTSSGPSSGYGGSLPSTTNLAAVAYARELKLDCTEPVVHYHADAAHNVWPNCKGHYGAAISFGKDGTYLYLVSSMMRMVTRSTAETEMVAFTEKVAVALHLARLLYRMGVIETYKVQAWQDNTAAISLMKAGKALSGQMKHIHLREFWLKQFIDNQEVDVNYYPSKTFNIDGASKPKAGLEFQGFVDRALGMP